MVRLAWTYTLTTALPLEISTTTDSMISMFANRQDCLIASTAIGATARSKMQPRKLEWVSLTVRLPHSSLTSETAACKTCSLFVELDHCSSETRAMEPSP